MASVASGFDNSADTGASFGHVLYSSCCVRNIDSSSLCTLLQWLHLQTQTSLLAPSSSADLHREALAFVMQKDGQSLDNGRPRRSRQSCLLRKSNQFLHNLNEVPHSVTVSLWRCEPDPHHFLRELGTDPSCHYFAPEHPFRLQSSPGPTRIEPWVHGSQVPGPPLRTYTGPTHLLGPPEYRWS